MMILRQPYPLNNEPMQIVKLSLIIGSFIFLFLLIFQPFGLHGLEQSEKVPVILGYGTITFVAILLFRLVLIILARIQTSEERWTVGKELGVWVGQLFLIGLGNWIYTAALGFAPFTVSGFLIFQLYTLAVGVIPSAALIFLNYGRLRQQYESAAKNIQTEENETVGHEKVHLVGELQGEELKIEAAQLLYIKSVDNYLEIYLKDQIQPVVFRGTLKSAEEQLGKPYILRCHRSYLVSMVNVKEVTGNSQGLQLHFLVPAAPVPVSRSQIGLIQSYFGTNGK